MKNSKSFLISSLGLALLALNFQLISCGSSGTSSSTTAVTRGLTFTTAADFNASAVASISKSVLKTTTGQCSLLDIPAGETHPSMDDPRMTDGLDCDQDSRYVRHTTPSKYSIAFKRITLLASEGSNIDLVADTGTLANSTVIDFTPADTSESVISIDASDLAAGTYTGVKSELYYFQLRFPVAGVDTNVRIYMSDDDFASEGNLGHHQGDVTFIDDNGNELGWIDSTWLVANLVQTRPATMGGAATPDSETGHDRGFFGNNDLWNQATFVQGTGQDIYYDTFDFDEPLVIPAPSTITGLTTVTVTFSTADTFYYEDGTPFYDSADFPGFYPDNGGDANNVNAEWAPQTPTATATVVTE